MPGCLDRYGNILNVDTTGASEATAKPEGLSYSGVLASEKIAEKDLKNMEKYKAKITEVGNSNCVDPAVIAGIISRESHAGSVLKDGWGDHGNAFGLMQVDKRYHKIVGSWDSKEHIAQGTEILCGMINEIEKKFPTWTKEQQLKATIPATLKKEHNNFENVRSSMEETWLYSRELITNEAIVMAGSLYFNYNTKVSEVINAGGISAYNAGANNVRSYDQMDIGTTHHDYANDVVARAKFYKINGY